VPDVPPVAGLPPAPALLPELPPLPPLPPLLGRPPLPELPPAPAPEEPPDVSSDDEQPTAIPSSSPAKPIHHPKFMTHLSLG
jgi:hypothetical protein